MQVLEQETLADGDEMPRNESNQSLDRDLFLTDNNGGLNVESSPLNLPIKDSPDLMNVEINPSGNVSKRKGSELVVDDLEQAHSLIPYILPNNLKMMYVVDGAKVRVYLIPSTIGGDWTEISNFEPFVDSLHTKSKYTRVSWTVTNEPQSKIYMVREGNVPIILFVVARKVRYSSGSSVTYNTVSDFNLGGGAADAGTFHYITDAGEIHHCASFSSSGGTTTYTLSTNPVAATDGVLLQTFWAACAEGVILEGEQIYDSYFKFETNKTSDTVVEIPSSLLDGISEDSKYWTAAYPNVGLVYPAYSDGGGSTATLFYVVNPKPQAQNPCVSNFFWSNGQYAEGGTYDVATSTNNASTTGSYVDYGVTHITFGGTRVNSGNYTEPPTPISFIRVHYLPFNGGNGVAGDDLFVYSDRYGEHDWIASSSTTVYIGTNPNYVLRKSDNSATTSSADTSGKFISFEGNYPNGVSSEECYIFHLNISSDYVSSDYDSTNLIGEQGAPFGIYGLSEFCNYSSGTFPTLVSLFNGRLVLAGMEDYPNVLAFSCVDQWTKPNVAEFSGNYYRNFSTIKEDPTISTTPFQIRLNTDSEEYITNLGTWYDNLFVTTNKNTYRVYAGSNGFTATSYKVSRVGKIGGLKHCKVSTSEGVIFLGKAGVYQIKLNSDTGSYYLDNIGIKIRKYIRESSDFGERDSSYMFYDPIKEAVYLGAGDSNNLNYPRKLFVYYLDSKAWSEWCDYSGFFPTYDGASVDGRTFFIMGHSDSTYTTSDLSQTTAYATEIIEMNKGYTDYKRTVTLNDTDYATDEYSAAAYVRLPSPYYKVNRDYYATSGNVLINLRDNVLRTVPINSIDSYTQVDIDGVGATLNTDYFRKRPQLILVDTDSWGATEDLEITFKDDYGTTGCVNIWDESTSSYLTETTDFVVDVTSTGTTVVYGTSTTDGGSYELSFNYPCWYFSPVFTRQNISNFKRMYYWYGIFNSNLYNTEDNEFIPLVYEDGADTNVRYDYLTHFNIGTLSHGIYEGYTVSDIVGASTLVSVTNTDIQWGDYFRVAKHLDGNYTDFQFVLYSFNRGTFDMVGYQLQTDSKGRTSLGARYD